MCHETDRLGNHQNMVLLQVQYQRLHQMQQYIQNKMCGRVQASAQLRVLWYLESMESEHCSEVCAAAEFKDLPPSPYCQLFPGPDSSIITTPSVESTPVEVHTPPRGILALSQE